jgi:hypothetical protein
MKYRVRIDLSFDNQTTAAALMNSGKSYIENAAPPGNGRPAFCEMEECRHDESLPCTIIERVEVAGGEQP